MPLMRFIISATLQCQSCLYLQQGKISQFPSSVTPLLWHPDHYYVISPEHRLHDYKVHPAQRHLSVFCVESFYQKISLKSAKTMIDICGCTKTLRLLFLQILRPFNHGNSSTYIFNMHIPHQKPERARKPEE